MKSSNRQLNLSDTALSKKKDKKEEEKLTLQYNLFDLPTAQHKAGLAGLLVMIESMDRRGLKPLPEISELGPTRVKISFTQKSLQVVFDDLFAAEIIEIKVENKIKEKKVPIAGFLETMGMPTLWRSLWKDVITQVLRAGSHNAMKPFEYRLPGIPKPKVMDWEKLWNNLLLNKADKLNSSEMVGAESENAERVPYSKQPEDALLLPFWPVVTLPYVTQKLKRPKNRKIRDYLFSNYAFALVIPEVSCLDEFVEDIFDLYPQCLDDKTVGNSARPMQAVIATPKEAALIFASRKYAGQIDIFPIPDFVSSLSVIHIKYGKGSPEVIEDSTIVPSTKMLHKYEMISSAYYSPFFKAQLINNMFAEEKWYHNTIFLFSNYPKEFFVNSVDSPERIPGYYRDCRKKFFAIQQMEEEEMDTEEGRDKLFAKRIYDLINRYVWIKSESKSGKKVKEFKKDENGKLIYPKEYRKTVEEVSMDAFLAMRGRREQDFVEYFTGSICSIPQFLPEKDFLLISQALIEDWEKVKALSMLAISASSYISNPKKDANGEQS